MKKYAIDLIFAAGLVLSILLHSFSAFADDCEQVQHSVLRLHIPADSIQSHSSGVSSKPAVDTNLGADTVNY